MKEKEYTKLVDVEKNTRSLQEYFINREAWGR